MCIKFFRSLTTHIYSLALLSPNRLRQTLLDPKEKNYLKNKLLKILQPNHQDFRRVRILFFFLDFIGNSLSAEHQSWRISIFAEYFSGPSDGLHRPIPTLCIFWFLPDRPPSLQINHLSWHVSKNNVNIYIKLHMWLSVARDHRFTCLVQKGVNL